MSFMIEEVTMITSSAMVDSSLITKYTICRSALCDLSAGLHIAHPALTSLCWNSLVTPKNKVVASCVENVSPTYSR